MGHLTVQMAAWQTEMVNTHIEEISSDWRNLRKTDLLAISKKYEEIIQWQGNDVLRARLGLSSSCIVKNNFLSYIRNFNTEHALSPIEEKKNVKNTFL